MRTKAMREYIGKIRIREENKIGEKEYSTEELNLAMEQLFLVSNEDTGETGGTGRRRTGIQADGLEVDDRIFIRYLKIGFTTI